MNIFKNLFGIITEAENPAGRKQKNYRALAKKRGLMSLAESVEAVKEGENLKGGKFIAETINVVESKAFLESVAKKQTISLKNVVLFSPNNLNGHYIPTEDMKNMVDQFNAEGVDKTFDILNIDHSMLTQDALGSYSNLVFDEEYNQILGDVEISRFNNSKLGDMIAALDENPDMQLGLSIEFMADDYDYEDGTFAFKETTLCGLALTLSPSAPQTLTTTKLDTASVTTTVSETGSTTVLQNGGIDTATMITVKNSEKAKETLSKLDDEPKPLQVEVKVTEMETVKAEMLNLETAKQEAITGKEAIIVELAETKESYEKALKTALETIRKLTETTNLQNEKLKSFDSLRKNTLKNNII
jgi:hypothetical protein